MTSELERIKILESKISQVIEHIHKLSAENEKFRQQVKDMKAEVRDYDEQVKKAGKMEDDLKRYEAERQEIKGKIETIISQIDKLGL